MYDDARRGAVLAKRETHRSTGGTPDLDLVAVFVAVAEAASFSAAARKLGLPKSTVSRSVAALEKKLGVQLLNRTTRRVAPSTAGAALRARVQPLVSELRRALEELPERDEEPSGPLRITAPVDLGSLYMPEILARFMARYPAVTLQVDLTNRTVDVVGEGFDLAMRIAPGRLADSSLTARLVGPVSGHVYAATAYMTRREMPRTLADLAELDFVIFHRQLPRFELGGEFVEPHGRIVATDLLLVKNAVSAGAGVGLLPDYLVEPDVAAGRLVRLLPDRATRSGNLYLVQPARRNVPAKVRAFRDAVLEEISRRPLG